MSSTTAEFSTGKASASTRALDSTSGADVHHFGKSSPLGATVTASGVNFSLFSRTATSVELLLFDREDDSSASRVISFDSSDNRTYYYWHKLVPGIKAGQLYGYRVTGPVDP